MSLNPGGEKMVIKCSFSFPLKAIGEYDRQAKKLPALPEFIIKRGPYLDEGPGAASQITTVFEFEKSKLREAWQNISGHLDALRIVPGFKLSAQVMEIEREAGKIQVRA
jgi:hypothetical protein